MMGKRTMLFRKKCKCVFFLSLLLLWGSMAFFAVHAQESEPAEKSQIPFDLERFLMIVEEQANPYLGLNIFRHTIEEIHKEWKELEAQQHHEVSQMIFVGDSRTYFMQKTLLQEYGKDAVAKVSFVCKTGEGLSWFETAGERVMRSEIARLQSDSDKPVAVIFNLGVNDLSSHNSGNGVDYKGEANAYLARMNTLAEELESDCRLFYMSVNPVNDGMASSCGYFINSDMVVSFNSVLQQAFPEAYLDVYSYLQQNGYGTSDGVHYDVGTYLVIQEYAKYLINQKES